MRRISSLFKDLVGIALAPIFYFQDWSLRRKVKRFTEIFGFDPYEAGWHTNQVRVMKMLLELGDKMPYEEGAAKRYKEAEKAARGVHFLTDPQYFKIFTDPEGREEFRRFLEELGQAGEE